MFRRLFRIGFGGCGCALEQEFRDHAVELTRELLDTYYLKDLEKWERVLDNELFKMDYLDDLRGILRVSDEKKQPEFRDATFEERLNEVSGRLYDWNSLLTKVEKVARPYDVTFIGKVRGTITKMRNEAKSIKNRGEVLLESLPVDSFTKTEAEKYKRFYTYNQNITETRELIVDQFGHAVIESQGFNHRPELQMLPFSIKEVRDEVFKKIRGYITNEKLSNLTSQGYFFYVGLGGGTGTGVISPLAEKFGKGSYGYFALAVLGAEVDNAKMKSQQPWFRRCFNMLIALNDLIVTAELDGLILVDNTRLIQAVDEDEEQGKREKTKTQGKQLVKVEEQPQESSEQKQTAEMEQPDETPSNGLKGTPLMTKVDEKLIKALYPAFGITTLENEYYDLDWSQLRGPIGLHALKNKPPIIVPCYASGPCSASEDNLKKLIDDALPDPNGPRRNGMLAPCEWKINNELIPDKVFVYVRCIKDEGKLRENLKKKFKTDDIAILKDYLFCWDDIVETEDYTELKRFLKDGDLCNISWADEAVPGKKDKDELLFCKKESNECVKLQIGRHLFDWLDGKIENYGELEKYFKRNKISWTDPPVSVGKNEIIIGGGETRAELTLDDENKKATLSWGEPRKKHILDVKEDNEGRQGIFEPNLVKIEIPGKTSDEIPLLGVKRVKKNDKYMRHLYLEGCNSSIDWVKKNLKKKIVVFESQEIGSFWHEREKKNEVLILLVNPGVREALEERFTEALKFVNLLVTFKELLEASTSEDKSGTADQIVNGDIEKVSFKRDDEKDVKELKEQLEGILKDISDVGIDKKSDKNGKKLEEARDFLLPKELYEKDKNIYEYMKGVLERLEKESKFLSGYLEGTRDWPIFREKIFNIISTSGKRDEVILSAISAIGDETKKKFDRLVGDAYASYLGTFERQFFKYNPSYLYHSMDNILSDDAEYLLPGELKNKINEINEKQRKGTGSDAQSSKKFEEKKKEELAKLVEDNLNEPAHLFFIPAKDKEGKDRWPDLKDSWDNGHDHNDLKALFIQNKVILPDKTVYVPGKYLFSWNDVLGNDSRRLSRYLQNDHNVNLAESVKFEKTDGDQSISIGENLAKIKIVGNNEKATLEINGVETLDLKVKKEVKNEIEKLIIYEEDDNERTMIDIEDDPEKIYSIKNGGEHINVYGPNDLSFPAMLALAGLYADWQYLLSWNESPIIPEDDGEKLIKVLFKKDKHPYGEKFEICASSKVKDFDKKEIRDLLIIDEDKEKATLIARRSSGVLFNWNHDGSPEPKLNEKLPPDLVTWFDKERHIDVNKWEREELKKDKEWRKWRIYSKDSKTYDYYYLTEKGKNQFEITGDRVHELKVKVDEVREENKVKKKSKTLKIYKRWGDKFEAAENVE